jgi:hypothetical protein
MTAAVADVDDWDMETYGGSLLGWKGGKGKR